MAKKYTAEKILETLATELANHTPGTPEYEKIFKQYFDLSQLLENKRSNTQKEALEYNKIKIDQQRADQEANKIKIDHEDRITERNYQKELEELKQRHAMELAKVNKSAEKLKATYAIAGTLGGAAITAAASFAVMKSANKHADRRLQASINSEREDVYSMNATKQTETNSLKTIYK